MFSTPLGTLKISIIFFIKIKIFNFFLFKRHDNHTSRLTEVMRWQSEGGVCVINYELLRKLLDEDSKDMKRFPLRQRKKFQETLCNPGTIKFLFLLLKCF